MLSCKLACITDVPVTSITYVIAARLLFFMFS